MLERVTNQDIDTKNRAEEIIAVCNPEITGLPQVSTWSKPIDCNINERYFEEHRGL